MVATTLDGLNSEILRYQSLAQEMGDTRIIPSAIQDKLKIVSNELLFEDENVHLTLSLNPTSQKIACTLYVTEIDEVFVGKILRQVGLPLTEANIENYQRDPTLIEKFWNDRFIAKYNELMKYFRKSKMSLIFLEKFKPAFSKNSKNEIVDNFG
jgi:hypothetical protein